MIEESSLWQKYESDPSDANRANVIEFYLPFAKALAVGFYRNWISSEIAVEDFIQLATVGLLEAIDGYESQKNSSFKVYARYRIRGSMLNAISQYSENLSFSSYKRKLISERTNSIDSFVGGEEISQFERFVKLTIGSAYVELLTRIDFDTVHQAKSTRGYKHLTEDVVKLQVLDLVDRLPERDRSIIHLHYIEGLTFTEIAKSLKVSKATVSLCHAQAILQLQDMHNGKSKLTKRF